MEFTLSRVALCIGGAVMLAAAVGVMSGEYETDVDKVDGILAERIAEMLDAFESSEMDILILEGPSILPDGRFLYVHDNIVELHSDRKVHTAVTEYAGEFRIDYTETTEITRRTSRLSS